VIDVFREVSDGKASMISDHMTATMRGPWKIALYAQWTPRLASATDPVEFVSLPGSGKMGRGRAGQAPPFTGLVAVYCLEQVLCERHYYQFRTCPWRAYPLGAASICWSGFSPLQRPFARSVLMVCIVLHARM
jgi:hypothetical protein